MKIFPRSVGVGLPQDKYVGAFKDFPTIANISVIINATCIKRFLTLNVYIGVGLPQHVVIRMNFKIYACTK